MTEHQEIILKQGREIEELREEVERLRETLEEAVKTLENIPLRQFPVSEEDAISFIYKIRKALNQEL